MCISPFETFSKMVNFQALNVLYQINKVNNFTHISFSSNYRTNQGRNFPYNAINKIENIEDIEVSEDFCPLEEACKTGVFSVFSISSPDELMDIDILNELFKTDNTSYINPEGANRIGNGYEDFI